jgi:2-haloacid dehalogenase
VNGASDRVRHESVQALVFDVFGTVVDWRGSITREGEALGRRLGVTCDWASFADAWRLGYAPAMQEVRSGALPWISIDGLHRRILDRIWERFGLPELPEAERAEFNRAWHRLDPWPDAVAGLNRLKARFAITTLSNGNVSLLVDMARRACLPWDAVFSAELFGHYKPDPEVYLGAARLLDLAPQQVMMVAAHPSDLRAAAACGLRTAYVDRPLEWGAGGPREPWQSGDFDIAVGDFGALADRLGA